jgi:hypothetical protein
MNSSILRKFYLTAALISPLAIAIGCTESGHMGSSQEVSHTESDKTGWFGGQTHEANTVYKNSDGSSSVETETTTTNGNTTTVVREKKTTNLDGTVSVSRETHTMVKGTDNTVSETKTTN